MKAVVRRTTFITLEIEEKFVNRFFFSFERRFHLNQSGSIVSTVKLTRKENKKHICI